VSYNPPTAVTLPSSVQTDLLYRTRPEDQFTGWERSCKEKSPAMGGHSGTFANKAKSSQLTLSDNRSERKWTYEPQFSNIPDRSENCWSNTLSQHGAKRQRPWHDSVKASMPLPGIHRSFRQSRHQTWAQRNHGSKRVMPFDFQNGHFPVSRMNQLSTHRGQTQLCSCSADWDLFCMVATPLSVSWRFFLSVRPQSQCSLTRISQVWHRI